MNYKINFIAGCLVLSSCVASHDEIGLKPAVRSIPVTIARKDVHFNKNQIIYLPNFDSIVVENGLNLKILKAKQNRVLSKSINMVFLDGSKKDTLRISGTKINNKNNIVYLQLNKIPKHIEVNGNSKLTIKAPKNSRSFSLSTHANSDIRITGWPNIYKIDNQGSANIYAYTLRGNQLDINSNGGQIYLAGGCNHLIASLSNNARLDAQGLKTNHIWLNGSENTKAKIMPIKTLEAVASGNSQISYFKQLHQNKVNKKTFDQANIVFVNKFRDELKPINNKKNRNIVINY